MAGWLKVKPAAEYAGVSERTFRDWLKSGLKHARLPSGTILVTEGFIDDFLDRFVTDFQQTDQVVNELFKEVKGGQGS